MSHRQVQQPRDRGAVIPLTAMMITVLVLMVAFAVDLGRLASERRSMQADADVIALDLARLADGRTEQQILASSDYADTLVRSAGANQIAPTDLVVEYGVYDKDLDVFTATSDTEIPNAVKITASAEIDYKFAGVIGANTGHTSRTAMAAHDAIAGFQVGSRLVNIDSTQASILNTVLTQALGGSPGLSAVGYQGLVDATIPLGPLAAELGFGSPEELASADAVDAQDFYLASAQVMEANGNTAAASALNAIAANTDSSMTLDMGNLMKVEQGGAAAAANASVDLFSLVTGSAFAINGANTISIPSLSLGLPGASTTITLGVIEKPRFTFGRVGATVTTQQISLGLDTTITNFGISVAGLTGTTVSGTIPISVDLAGATGTLTNIDCARPGIDVGLDPQPVTAAIGQVDLSVSADVLLLGSVPVATVSVPATNLGVTGTAAGQSFLHPDEFLPAVGSGTMKPAPTTSLSLAALQPTGAHVTALGVISLNSNLLVQSLNNSLINPVLTSLSTVIAAQLSQLLGLDVGGADIGALDMTCDSVRLVG